MATDNLKLSMIVLKRDGLLHLTLTSVQLRGQDPVATAQGWVDEGYNVFVIGANGKTWVVNHFESGKMLSSMVSSPHDTSPDAVRDLLQLPKA